MGGKAPHRALQHAVNKAIESTGIPRHSHRKQSPNLAKKPGILRVIIAPLENGFGVQPHSGRVDHLRAPLDNRQKGPHNRPHSVGVRENLDCTPRVRADSLEQQCLHLGSETRRHERIRKKYPALVLRERDPHHLGDAHF
eukprot:Amastigsp_a517457_20.p4 type:complete len:140 gc:universal Amastigsp_a517457_20:1246-827(-)